MDAIVSQYDWIQRTRESLFRYCETMSPEDYLKELETFAGDSIRNLHVHVADCYRVWLGSRALNKPFPEIKPDSVKTVHEMREVYKKIDSMVHEFLNEFNGKWDQTVLVTFERGDRVGISGLWLFTHTITHEFHHKGQIVKIGRQLGYVPPDTDLIEYFRKK